MYHEELFRGGKNKHTIYKHIKLKVNLAFRNAKNKTICIFTDYLDSALLKLENNAYITTQESISNPELKESVIILYNDTKIEQEQTAKVYEDVKEGEKC